MTDVDQMKRRVDIRLAGRKALALDIPKERVRQYRNDANRAWSLAEGRKVGYDHARSENTALVFHFWDSLQNELSVPTT